MRAFALLVFLLAVGTGIALLGLWIAPGTVPGARSWLGAWPLVFAASAAAIAAAGALRRADALAFALGGLAWAFGIVAVTELPPVASTFRLGDGPWLYPVYVVVSLAAGLYGVAGPRSHTTAERAVALLVLFATAGTRLFARGETAVFALLLAAVLAAFVCAERRFSAAELVRSPARLFAGIAAAFFVWMLAAALHGDSPTHGLTHWARLLTGALFAWTLAGAAGPRGFVRGFQALLAGLAISFLVLLVGLLQTAHVLGWSWIATTRLRLFDLHPGLIAPFFSVGLCLALAWAAARRKTPLAAAAGLGLALLSGLTLARGEARASLIGAVAGFCVLCFALARLLPRRSLAWGVSAVVVLVVGAALWLSPLGRGERERLDAEAFTSSALGQRYHYWRMAGGAMRRNPWLGQGLRSEWARTDLARPSYLDGGEQELHAHNLILSVGEAAGVPAALLFVLLSLGVLELGRRAALRDDEPGLLADRGARILSAGLLAGVAAHLAANLLSMGQAQETLLPLYLWIAAGLFGARLAGERAVRPAGASKPRIAAALALLLLFGAAPVAGWVHAERGRAALARGENELALRSFDRALAVNPLDRSAEVDAAKALFAVGDADGAIERLERACASSPRRSSWHFTRGAALLAADRAGEAIAALERAFELDPRGRRAGDYLAARAWAHLRLDEPENGRACLAEALRQGSTYWTQIPMRRLAPEAGDPPDAARIALLVGDPKDPRTMIPLCEILEQLAAEALAELDLNPPDVMRARRLVGHTIEGYRAQSLWREPLALMEAYAARVPERYSNTDSLYVSLLCDAGRLEEADRIARGASGERGFVPEQEMLRYYRARSRRSDDPATLERAQAIAARLGPLQRDDVWFTRGKFHELFGFLAELAVRRGDIDAALVYHEQELFDLPDAAARAEACARLLGVLVETGADDEALAAQAERYVAEASHAASLVENEAALAHAARTLAGALDDHGEQGARRVAEELEGDGPTAELFLAELREAL